MKGTEVTQEEITSVENFLVASGNDIPERAVMRRDQIVRLLAWYGALRLRGDGSGKFICRNSQAAAESKEKV